MIPVYSPKIRTWSDNWNDVIRIIFKDRIMRELMLIPDDCTITQFIDKYFIEASATDEILTDEKVRILWFDGQGSATRNQGVRIKTKEFEIFVHKDYLHKATNDRLQNRCRLIEQRLKEILLSSTHICQLRFHFESGYNLWTKSTGYVRYHSVFSYKVTT